MSVSRFVGRAASHGRLLVLLVAVRLGVPSNLYAICGLDGAVQEQLQSVDDPQALRALTLKIRLHGTCSACHIARYGGPRNEFGSAVNTLLTVGDRENRVVQRDAGRRITDLLADPSRPDSPTFGELFRLGRFPANSLQNAEPPLPQAQPRTPENITPEQAKELVNKIEAESRFGILQLSRTEELTPETASALAEFRGEMLILGIRSITPETAEALAMSQAETLWLHSLTSLSPDVAESLAKLRGHLVLTGLTQLDSVSLAEKLTRRPGALSFPYLKSLTPEIATALAKSERSLTLAGLTEITPEVQDRLAQTFGTLSLPNLRSLDSLLLAQKLAAVTVLLPKLEKLTAEQVQQFIGFKGQSSFWGGVALPLDAITPETAKAMTATSLKGISLTLVGNKLGSNEILETLLDSSLKITLQDVEELSPDQIRIAFEALNGTSRTGPLDVPRLSLPSLQRLDSAILAEALGGSTGFNFPGVTSISPEAAAALGALPEKEYIGPLGQKIMGPSGSLSFPSLRELSPEIARLMLRKRWGSISLPALQDVSLETIRLLAKQTPRLTLGISGLPPEFAGAFADAPTEWTFGNGTIAFPYVTELAPEAARILVESLNLNRGVGFIGGNVRVSQSPRLIFGGEQGRTASGFPTLSPELAKELSKYEGSLEIQGLGELPDESAAALASFPGPYLVLSGPFSEKLSPAAAESLSKTPGVLQLSLRRLDSVPLAQRFAQQINWTLYDVETVSAAAAPVLSKYKQFFNLRALTVLDSPELARRFVEGNTTGNSITLPALTTLSPEAAQILGAGSKSLYLGLTVLDSPETALALTKSRSKVALPRLRAITPQVNVILQEAPSIEVPPLESLYLLTERRLNP
ncbi:MAG: hypothetical protein R3C01_06975 [Planctomycetaceae bacterium]